MQYTEIIKKLFQWNAKNLVHNAHINKSEIGNFFADQFLVRANGKSYDANYDNYLEFLNGFRSTIRSISYKFDDFIAEKYNVVVPMSAFIVRIDGSVENFEAILILKFNQDNKIVLWREVYVKT